MLNKHALPVLLLSIFLSGCFWSSGSDGNYTVQVNNHTNSVIVVYYNVNEGEYDESTGDYQWTYEAFAVIDPDSSEVIEVRDDGFAAEIRVEYQGKIIRYGIDPDFWGWAEVDVNIGDFA